jgi:hypothetical protein
MTIDYFQLTPTCIYPMSTCLRGLVHSSLSARLFSSLMSLAQSIYMLFPTHLLQSQCPSSYSISASILLIFGCHTPRNYHTPPYPYPSSPKPIHVVGDGEPVGRSCDGCIPRHFYFLLVCPILHVSLTLFPFSSAQPPHTPSPHLGHHPSHLPRSAATCVGSTNPP